MFSLWKCRESTAGQVRRVYVIQIQPRPRAEKCEVWFLQCGCMEIKAADIFDKKFCINNNRNNNTERKQNELRVLIYNVGVYWLPSALQRRARQMHQLQKQVRAN